MNSEVRLDSLSNFGRIALIFDLEMQEFEKLGREIGFLDLESDKGFARGSELLAKANSCRDRLDATMRELAQELVQSRQRNEATEQQLALQIKAVRARQAEGDELIARLAALKASVTHVNQSMKQLSLPTELPLKEAEARELRDSLAEASRLLESLVLEAKKLVEDARARNFKALEHTADALMKALYSAKNRVRLFAEDTQKHASGAPEKQAKS